MSAAQELTRAMRGSWRGHYGVACCPAHGDKTPSLSIADGTSGRVLLKCHTGCSYAAISAALSSDLRPVNTHETRADDMATRQAARARAEKASKQAAAIWAASLPISGTPAEHYLRQRGITCALPPLLRYAPDCWHLSARRLPALLCKVTGQGGAAIHRIYLTYDGRSKAAVTPARMPQTGWPGAPMHWAGRSGRWLHRRGRTGMLCCRRAGWRHDGSGNSLRARLARAIPAFSARPATACTDFAIGRGLQPRLGQMDQRVGRGKICPGGLRGGGIARRCRGGHRQYPLGHALAGLAEPPVLWTMAIGSPSSNKSPGVDAVLTPLKQIERDQRSAIEADLIEWRKVAELAKLAESAWRDQAKAALKDGAEPPERPETANPGPELFPPRLSIADGTVERLAVIAAKQPRGTLLARDELAGWLQGMTRYAGGGSDRPFWLEAYGGRDYTVERMGREPVHIDRLSIGVTGGIHPDRLKSLLMQSDDDGLLARFMPI